MSVNKEVLRAWVAALRSGEYQQTNGTLRRDNAFCCLGVLCDIAPNMEWSEEGARYIGEHVAPDKKVTSPVLLPYGVSYETFGWGLRDPVLEIVCQEGQKYCSLAELNDQGFTFEQIADLIEYEWVLK